MPSTQVPPIDVSMHNLSVAAQNIARDTYELRWVSQALYNALTERSELLYYFPHPPTPNVGQAQTSVTLDEKIKWPDLTSGGGAGDDSELVVTLKHLLGLLASHRQVVYRLPKPTATAPVVSAVGTSPFNVRNEDDTYTTVADMLDKALFKRDITQPLIRIPYIKDIQLDIALATTRLRDGFNYIGNCLSLNGVSIAAIFAYTFNENGEWNRDAGSYLRKIANKEPTVNVNVNPRVVAEVDMNESGLTINNQITVPPAQVSINNIIDACCSDPTAPVDPPVPPPSGGYTPIDPTYPVSPQNPTNQPYKPIVPIIVQAHQKKGACGFVFYVGTHLADYLEWVFSVRTYIKPLVITSGLTVAIGWLRSNWFGKAIGETVWLNKMTDGALRILVNCIAVLDSGTNIITSVMRLKINDLACDLPDSTNPSSAAFWITFIGMDGFPVIAEATAKQALDMVIQQYIENAMYDALNRTLDYDNYAEYCPCAVSDCGLAANQLVLQQPNDYFATSPFYYINGVLGFAANEIDGVSTGAETTFGYRRYTGNVMCVAATIVQVTIPDNNSPNGYAIIPIDSVTGVSDVYPHRVRLVKSASSNATNDMVQIEWSVLQDAYTPFDDTGSISLPNGERRQGQWTWEKSTIVTGTVTRPCIKIKGFLGLKAPSTDALTNLESQSNRTSDGLDLMYCELINLGVRVIYTPPVISPNVTANMSIELNPDNGDAYINTTWDTSDNIVKVEIRDENDGLVQQVDPLPPEPYVTVPQSLFTKVRPKIYMRDGFPYLDPIMSLSSVDSNSYNIDPTNWTTMPEYEDETYSIVVFGEFSKVPTIITKTIRVYNRIYSRHRLVSTEVEYLGNDAYLKPFNQDYVSGLPVSDITMTKAANSSAVKGVLMNEINSPFNSDGIIVNYLVYSNESVTPSGSDDISDIFIGDMDGVLQVMLFCGTNTATETQYTLYFTNALQLFVTLLPDKGLPLIPYNDSDFIYEQDLLGYYRILNGNKYDLGCTWTEKQQSMGLGVWLSFQVKLKHGNGYLPSAVTVGLFNDSGVLLQSGDLSQARYKIMGDFSHIVIGGNSPLAIPSGSNGYITIVTIEWSKVVYE